MNETFLIDGVEYPMAGLSSEGLQLLSNLMFVRTNIQDLSNQMAVLGKAKNAYITDLKTEMIKKNTGVDLSDLFSDD